MTPKEKANQIIEMFRGKVAVCMNCVDVANHIEIEKAELNDLKECALIAVELRLDGHFMFSSIEYGEDGLEYWEQVKTEIERL